MTVQELIEHLQKVEDKNRTVVIERFDELESIGFYDLGDIDEYDCRNGLNLLTFAFRG